MELALALMVVLAAETGPGVKVTVALFPIALAAIVPLIVAVPEVNGAVSIAV